MMNIVNSEDIEDAHQRLKHAYLIIAHNEFEILKRLVAALDDSRNDIFVHIDRKVEQLPEIYVRNSRLSVLDNRVDVRWGSDSQIKVEMLLFETALKNGEYDYFHLISGTHLPVSGIEKINSFFEHNKGQEIVHLWDYDGRDVSNKLRTYHFFMRWYNSSNIPVRKTCQFVWRVNLRAQHMLGIKRHRMNEFVKADNWASLTHEAVKYLVENKKKILRKYRWTFCGDEYFVPSELAACGDRFKFLDCPKLLFVKFKCANAVNLEYEDIESLVGSDFLFARKFSSAKPDVLKLVEKLYEG